jgi:phenylalanyl-tRNA synthetase beta chain
MILSYNWLMEYLPVPVEPEKLSRILNSIGLEVESFDDYEEVKGGLEGLIIGKVLDVTQHPNADKLSQTRVDIGKGDPLQIVCGAPNVAPGQTVVVAPVGTTIYPKTNPPMTMRVAKIRGVESYGMICAEDEIGLGDSHAGIMVIQENVAIGSPAAAFFKPYSDKVISIGLTPNRSDAMSHLGVARDICAWLNHHEQLNVAVKSPLQVSLPESNNSIPVSVSIENPEACPRYSGVSISGVKVGASPLWMQQRLKAIGLRPINNIVDITNYILHETGQPLHAFDADHIEGQKIIVKNLPTGTPFISLDEKERKLDAEDLMICNGKGEGMCIGGVFGGLQSGVSNETNNVFLEKFFPA